MSLATAINKATREADGDQCVAIRVHERWIRGRDDINLKPDPPPDLAIEAVCTHEADEVLEVYRRICVPEVWVCDEAELVILILQANASTRLRRPVRRSRS